MQPKPLINSNNKMADTYNKMKEIQEKYGKLVIIFKYIFNFHLAIKTKLQLTSKNTSCSIKSVINRYKQ